MPRSSTLLLNLVDCTDHISKQEEVYLRIWKVFGIVMHPQHIDAHLGASWQAQPIQLCVLTAFSDLQSHTALNTYADYTA